MHEGENVPVSLFNTENGLKGFVFSYDLTEPGVQTTSVSILTDGVIKNDVSDTEGSLSGTGDAGSEYSYVTMADLMALHPKAERKSVRSFHEVRIGK